MEAEFYFNRGVERSQQRDLQGAIEDYSIAITLSSGTECKTLSSKQPDGSSISVDVIEGSVGYESMYFNRACVYIDLGNYAAAIKDFTKFVEYNQNDAEVFFKRAIAHYCLENVEDAEQDLKLANSLDPKYNNESFLAVFRG